MCELLGLIVTGVIGLVIGVIGAKLHHDLQLDRVYLAPFRKWCADFYDELYEFQKRYLDPKRQPTEHSTIQVIDDWRALHDISAYAVGWLAKIRKEEGQWVLQFEELLRSIDGFWHKLETEEQFVLQNRSDIIGLGLVKQTKIAIVLQNEGVYLLQTEEHKKIIEHVLRKYLPKKIPSENILMRLWKRI